MSVMIKALGYYSHKGGKAAKGLAKVKSHLKYLEHGKIHRNEPIGFDREKDEVSRREFLDRLETQPERGVIAHKLVLSLSQDERDRLGLDMRDLVRETMSRFEAKLGRELHWVGYEHDDPGHPHVHVVVAGYDREGKQVGIHKQDLAQLREVADREKDRLGDLNRATGLTRSERAEVRAEPPVKEPQEPDREPSFSLLGALQKLIREMLREDRSRGMERER